ncbi:PAS domain S-box-containing protein [Desulfonatronum thiosulfatophilum]|uniref:histidine kinase n=1 Tax=Desulfonatronum thiosulfatophilum TaxID=617002 RepID=A0A1G6E3H6_9BACT|nr:PAS domain-containing protein [Desulfonatronum thiosulfatophilum]SDB51938.1 PAS domain S-box-containing protein [Desulfonatronum thiosulfatophilum]
MSTKEKPTDAEKLRERAEKLAKKKAKKKVTDEFAEMTENERLRLLHELSVHKIELELQNEDLRRAHEKLDAEHARFQDLYDFAPVGYVTIDKNNLIHEVNLTAATLLGIRRIDLIGQSLSNLILPEDQDLFFHYRKRALGAEEVQAEEMRLLKQDGSWFWGHFETSSIQDTDNGQVCRIVFSDITRRKLEEENTTRTSALLETAGRVARFGGWSADLVENRVHLTPQAAEIRGKPDELHPTLKEAGAYYAPESRKKMGDAFRKCVREGVPYDVEVEMFTAQGERIWVRNLGAPVRDASGAIVRVEGSIQDITRSKRAEEEARQAQALLGRAGRMALFGGWRMDLADKRIVLIGETAAIHEMPPDYSPSFEEAFNLITPEWRDTMTEVFDKCVHEGIPFDEEIEIVTIKGNRIWVRIIGEAIRDGSGAIVGVEGAFQDITESKQFEEEILRVNNVLEKAGRMARFGGWSINLHENRVYWTPEVAAIHEMPADFSPSLEEGLSFYAPEWRDKITEVFGKCAHEGVPYDEEMQIVTSQGRLIWVRAMGEPIRDSSGVIVRVEGAFQDISERKRAEEKILRTNILLEQTSRLAKFGAWNVNLAEQKVYLAQNTSLIHGFPQGYTPTVEECFNAYAPESREKVIEVFRKCEKEGVPFDEEMELIVGNGERRWVRGVGEAVRDASGAIVRVIGAMQDISDRKRTELEILRIKTMLERAASMALFGGWSVNVAERRLYVSGQATEIYGLGPGDSLTPEDAISRYIPEWQQTIVDAFDKCVQKGEPFDVEVEIINKRGNRIWIRKTGEAIRNESGEVVRVEGAIQDITDRVQDKEALVRNNQKLQKALDEKDKFFSIIAHDLKSPLAGFMALTRMLTDEFNTLPLKDLRRMAFELAQATETMFNLLKNLLEWSLMQRGLLTYNPVICLLADPIEHTIELFQTTAGNKNVYMQSELDQNLLVYADKQMLDTILRNFVSNAIKFSMSGGTIFISAVRDKDMAVVTVQDNGVGMDEEHLSNLFILTRKKSLRGTEGELGTGLGLLLCKDFVEKHGGRIWVESQPGKGSTFSFALPIADGVKPAK